MISVGRLIVERLYGGDLDAARARRRKDRSLRRLQRHPDLPFPPSMVSRSISTYLLSRRRVDLLDIKNLGASHLQELLGLAPSEQDHFLERLASEVWSVERLRAEIAKTHGTKERPGRLRRPTCVRQLRRLERAVESRALVADMQHIEQLALPELVRLLRTAKALCTQAEQITLALGARVKAVKCTNEHVLTGRHDEEEGPEQISKLASDGTPSPAGSKGRTKVAVRKVA
jgi:hypothetical protein